jgi:NAD+ synthase (glutamine-hydrolysing)
MTLLRIALGQIGASVGDIAANAARIVQTWERAAGLGAELVVLPELALVGYPPDDLLLSSDLLDAAERGLGRIAGAGPAGTVAVVGTIRRSATGDVLEGWGVASAVRGLANSAAVLVEGSIVARYDKMRLPNEGVFDEARYFLPGDRPTVIDVAGVMVGIIICQDLWAAPGPVDLSVAAGAQVIVVLNASPYHRGKRAEREAWVRRHAAAHGVWVAYVNRVGGQDEVVFDGDSMVADPQGVIVARGAQFGEDLIVVDLAVDTPAVSDKVTPSPDGAALQLLPARSIAPPLGPVEELWAALVLATRDYCRGNGFREAIVGLSGGIDSAVTAALAVEALGADAVLGVAMPSPYSSTHSVDDAVALAALLGIRLETLPIGPLLTAAASTLDGLVVSGFDGARPAGVAYENLQSRLRGLLLMALSNERGSIVLTTGNKSEYAVGYATLYGDMSGGFAPLKDVLKSEVYELARHCNSDVTRIPLSTIDKPPSAELRPGQLDADSLPDYPTLDAILVGLIEDLRSVDELVAGGHPRDEVLRIIGLVDRAEHKRRQAAPGPKVSRRAFGRDRRVPITSGWDARHPDGHDDPDVDGEAAR